jgi:multidrug resistance protein, MATE family
LSLKIPGDTGKMAGSLTLPAAKSPIRLTVDRVLKLAIPVVLAELGWMAMGVVDTIMVGRISAEAIAAVGLGNSLFYSVVVCGMSVLLGMDTLVSQAYGAGRPDDCRKTLWHGVYLALAMSPLLMGIVFGTVGITRMVGVNAGVLLAAVPYLEALIWSVPPLLLYAALRRYLQGLGLVMPVMIALVTANLVNAFLNWVFIFGHLGVPAMGVPGSGWATVLSRIYMAAVLLVALYLHERSEPRDAQGRWRVLSAKARDWSPQRLRELLALGLPASGQVTLEVGVFGVATVMAAKFSAVALAAHEIVLNTVGTTFMVPLGFSSAAAVAVGHAIGRQDAREARRSGMVAISLGAGFMAVAGVVLYLFPSILLRVYTNDLSVIKAGVPLLFVCAWFQLFDGLQSVTTGALRGAGDTRTPMLVNLAGHWLIGLPLATCLAFWVGWGVFGLWIGLSAGLIFVGFVLISFWMYRSRHLSERHAATKS